ncbi:hypothetical protein GCM10010431_78340 [Streptomyces kunmingensis]
MARNAAVVQDQHVRIRGRGGLAAVDPAVGDAEHHDGVPQRRVQRAEAGRRPDPVEAFGGMPLGEPDSPGSARPSPGPRRTRAHGDAVN